MKKNEIKETKTADLVEFYNGELANLPIDSQIPNRPVKKFADRKTAERRVSILIDELAAAELMDEEEFLVEDETPQNKVQQPTIKRSANNSAGIARSWKNPEIARKRAERSAVEVDGTYYKSVRAAYVALGLDLRDHIQFRMLLKASGETRIDGRQWKIVPLNYDK